ncbi:MAG TPA: D-amino-acid transaminase [Tangfeifania sp.]|nr:D-amino-acid transaminase [Tangfeifania sp.]
MSEIVYLNGEFIHSDEAKISPNDRGFIFADGIYEVIKYYTGKPFRYQEHQDRLERSLREIGIHFKNVAELRAVFGKLLDENQLANCDAGIYVQITRGTYKRVHHFPENINPTVYAYTFALPSFKQNLENGIKVITHEDIRWLRCDIKSVALLPNTMLYNQAVEKGAGECVLIRNGFVTEATHSSFFGIKNGTVFTHPASNLILPGITQKVVSEICTQNNIPLKEEAVSEKDLYELDELFISGTGSEITPVVQVNETIFGNKKPGEITRLIQSEFFKLTN